MSRTIPISLQSHLDSGTTTICGLIRITPVRPGYGVVGLTTLDRDVVYDDGDGPVTYYAAVGYTASNYVGTADFTVDNAETQSLFPEFDIPQLTEADINAGAYDYAEYKMMLVNYDDLAQGHILYSTGTMGEMKVVDGLSFMGELRSLFQRYRQSIVERDSLTCRATFGSQAADSPLASSATKIERFPCGFDTTFLWFGGNVDSVGVESNVAFHSDELTQGDNFYVPGIVEWISGANAGRQYEVSFYSGGTVGLSFPAAFAIEIGDTFRIRPDCTKQWSGANSCFTYNNRLNFRGEPFIPVGDAGNTSNPGASTTPGLTPGEQGTVNENYTPQDPPTTPSITGNFYSGYVDTPYYARSNEGLIATPDSFNFFSSGLPENVTVSGITAFGYPTTAGTSAVTLTGGVVFGAPLTVSTSLEVLPSPSFTVFSPFDRGLQAWVPRFLAGPAPYLSVTSTDDGGVTDGYRMVRSLNGRTTGKHYWEVAVTTLPAGARFGAGIDASLQNGLTYDTQQLGDAAGQWGFTQNAGSASVISNSGSTSTTAAVQGDVICFAADFDAGRLWVRLNNGAWIGGGNPATGTSPTFSGLSIPGNSFWGDYRACALPGLGVTLTANFGSQAFAQSAPAGFTGWPWAKVNEMRAAYWESDNLSRGTGDGTIYGGVGLINPTGKLSQNTVAADVTGNSGSFAITGAKPSFLAGLAKASGKWQFEVSFENLRANRCRVGLADSTFPVGGTSSMDFPDLGSVAGSFGVLPNSSPTSSQVPGFPAIVYNNGAEVGSFTDVLNDQVLTFACDFGAGTVAIYRLGVLVGTYNISGTGPWRIAVTGFSGGGAILRTTSLAYPVATFTNWAP